MYSCFVIKRGSVNAQRGATEGKYRWLMLVYIVSFVSLRVLQMFYTGFTLGSKQSLLACKKECRGWDARRVLGSPTWQPVATRGA